MPCPTNIEAFLCRVLVAPSSREEFRVLMDKHHRFGFPAALLRDVTVETVTEILLISLMCAANHNQSSQSLTNG